MMRDQPGDALRAVTSKARGSEVMVERLVAATGRDCYFLVKYEACSIWPEARVSFAHSGKKISVCISLDAVRCDAGVGPQADAESGHDPNTRGSREEALARIEAMRAARGGQER